MEKVITRHWVNKKFQLSSGWDDSVHNFDDFSKFVDKWKVILVKTYKAQPGNKIGFNVGTTDIRYFSLFFAVAELGMSFVVYQKPMKENDLNNYKIKVFSPLDFMVTDEASSTDPLIVSFSKIHSKKTINLSDIGKVIDINDDGNQQIAGEILANPDDVFLFTTSSGTINTPKILNHTHKFFYDLCLRNSEIMGFTEIDRVMHIRNLHHGSSVSVFFLPSLKKCHNHSYHNFSEDAADKAVSHIVNYKVTKLLVPYNKVIDDFIFAFKLKQMKCSNLEIFNLSYLQDAWIEHCKDGMFKSITSIFGCNETGGPIFLPCLNKDTETVDSTYVGKPIDQFYELKIEKDILMVFLKTYNKWVSTEDRFMFIDNMYTYLGKKNLVRINDYEFELSDLKDFLNKLLNFDHELVYGNDKLFLAIFDPHIRLKTLDDIDDINQLIGINFNPLVKISVVKTFVKADFNYGIKLDHQLLRSAFTDHRKHK